MIDSEYMEEKHSPTMGLTNFYGQVQMVRNIFKRCILWQIYCASRHRNWFSTDCEPLDTSQSCFNQDNNHLNYRKLLDDAIANWYQQKRLVINCWLPKSFINQQFSFDNVCSIFSHIKIGSRKIPPRKIHTRKIPTHQTPPWKIPPGKFPPRKFPPISLIVFLHYFFT